MDARISLERAVQSYLFNSQLIEPVVRSVLLSALGSLASRVAMRRLVNLVLDRGLRF